MSKVICFKHPGYKGTETPALSCKACCAIFIAMIKDRNEKGLDTYEWLERMRK